MMTRRLTLQLTPLLDLLLIVMFSQYIENRHRHQMAQQELESAQTSLKAELQKAQDETRQRRMELDDRFNSIIEQHHQVGSLLTESLNLPGAAMAEVLKLRAAGAHEDAARLEQAAGRLTSMMNGRGDEVFRFFLKVDEMQKHVSIWEIHIQQNGQALISDGDQFFTADYATEPEFASRMFEQSKSFADPRTLVILLLTWGDAEGGQRARATDGMSTFVELLRKDAQGIRWFDFSIVGFRANGPIFSGKMAPK
ncbi:MAG: hypothetical protein ACK58L_22585 [Planctomycetota bacterium]